MARRLAGGALRDAHHRRGERGLPLLPGEVSSIGDVGGTIGFVLIALVWFYLVSLSMMAGGVINALRYELHDTGTMQVPSEPAEPSRSARR